MTPHPYVSGVSRRVFLQGTDSVQSIYHVAFREVAVYCLTFGISVTAQVNFISNKSVSGQSVLIRHIPFGCPVYGRGNITMQEHTHRISVFLPECPGDG